MGGGRAICLGDTKGGVHIFIIRKITRRHCPNTHTVHKLAFVCGAEFILEA